jgi:hypothetical protein
MQAFLKKHGEGHAHHSVKVEWSILGQEFLIKFSVNKRTSRPWLFDEAFTTDWSKNWGLWNKDVVEVFLQLRKFPDDIKAPYLELQVSPHNQPFALIVTEPRVHFSPPKELIFSHEVSVVGRSWITEMKVTLPTELLPKEPIDIEVYGSFFACLDQEPREYFALELNPGPTPDFHLPELFLPLKVHE